MPDATYVGAGMPCGNCGNPLTPGQPHKCGRVGNPYAPSADWKPGQDTFTAQAAGIWQEGFAAGRAAATPDPPTDERRPWPIAPDTVMPPRRQPVRWGSRADDPPTEIHDDPEKTKAYLAGLAAGRTEAAAASPDSPDDRESLIAAEFFAAGMRAASPDERLREALRVMIDVFDRHDRWCGHYADAPGDGIIHKVPAARAALAADREAPDEPKETT